MFNDNNPQEAAKRFKEIYTQRFHYDLEIKERPVHASATQPRSHNLLSLKLNENPHTNGYQSWMTIRQIPTHGWALCRNNNVPETFTKEFTQKNSPNPYSSIQLLTKRCLGTGSYQRPIVFNDDDKWEDLQSYTALVISAHIDAPFNHATTRHMKKGLSDHLQVGTQVIKTVQKPYQDTDEVLHACIQVHDSLRIAENWDYGVHKQLNPSTIELFHNVTLLSPESRENFYKPA